jgi:hypothetical protein
MYSQIVCNRLRERETQSSFILVLGVGLHWLTSNIEYFLPVEAQC